MTVKKEQVNDLLSQITDTGRHRPDSMIVYGVEGIGKTSFAAQAPDPLVIMTRGETGLETLMRSGALKPVRHFPEVESYTEFMNILDAVLEGDTGAKVLIVDCINGLAQLCAEHVCATKFNGDWGVKGFGEFGVGYATTLEEWAKVLKKLDSIRNKGIGIICTAHAQVKSFSNPEGNDYDRYTPDMNIKLWGATAKWADIILFMNYFTSVTREGFKNKGKGGDIRMAYAQRTAAWDAKNRHNMPASFSLGNSAAEGWENFKVAKNSK